MSMYQDIYRDLPSRVFKVWQQTKTHPEQKTEDMSVTAMLMAAAAGLAMPFENLKDLGVGNGNKQYEHPMFLKQGKASFQGVLKKCDDFFKQPINTCDGLHSVVLMQCQKLKDIRKAATDEKGDAVMDTSKYDVRFALKIFRNALAHNNIFHTPDRNEQIEKLVFFSENRKIINDCNVVDGWHVLVISVVCFEEFLNEWFDLLKGQGSFVGAALALADECNGSAD